MDNLIRLFRAIREDFKSMISDKTIPLETRMEWFATYGDEILQPKFNDKVGDSYTLAIASYLEDGWDETEVADIEQILQDGYSEEL